MEFFETYKKPIIAAAVGAITAIILSYLISIPFWVVGAIIGAVTVLFTDQIVEMFDKQTANYSEKRKAKKSADE